MSTVEINGQNVRIEGHGLYELPRGLVVRHFECNGNLAVCDPSKPSLGVVASEQVRGNISTADFADKAARVIEASGARLIRR